MKTTVKPRKKPATDPLLTARLAAAAVSFAAVCYVCFTFVLNYAHDYGYLIADTGWQTALLWRNDYSMPNPPMVADNVRFGADSFYQIHLAFLLAPFAWLSYFLPVSAEEWLAVFTSLGVAILAAAFTLAIGGFLRAETPTLRPFAALILATIAGFVLSLNPIIGNILIYPHFELWIPVLLVCILLAIANGRTKTAAFILLPLLLTREDAGLHLCMILWTVAAWRAIILRRNGEPWRRAWRAQKHLLMWSAPALAYSLICLLTPGWGRALPEPSVLELSTLVERWLAIVWRLEWTAPFALLIAAAIWWRRWSWLAGLVSCLPWIIYNSTQGGSGFAGDLQLYYSFPLIIALFWPFIAHQFIAPEKKRRNLGTAAALFVIIFAATTIIRPYSDTLSTRNSLRTLALVSGGIPSAEKREALSLAGDFLAARAERIIVADSFSVLRPHDVKHDRFLPLDDGDLNVCGGDFMFVNTTYFDNLRRNAMAAAMAFNLRHQYHLHNTSYRLFSARPLCDAGGNNCAGNMPLSEIPLGNLRQDVAARFGAQGMTWRGCVLRTNSIGQKGDQDGLLIPPQASGLVAELTDVPLPPGQYALDIIYRHETAAKSLLLEVRGGDKVLSSGYLPSNPNPKKGTRLVFNLSVPTAVSIRLGKAAGSELDLRKISLYPAANK